MVEDERFHFGDESGVSARTDVSAEGRNARDHRLLFLDFSCIDISTIQSEGKQKEKKGVVITSNEGSGSSYKTKTGWVDGNDIKEHV